MSGDQDEERREISPEEDEEHLKEVVEQRIREVNDDRVATFNRSFETVKHLTTLSAGSTVLIGTFLQDIFPKSPGGELAVGTFTKWLIASSFVLFGVSLIAASLFMYVFSGGFTLFPVRIAKPYKEDDRVTSFPTGELIIRHGKSRRRVSWLEQLQGHLMQIEKRTRKMVRWAFFLPFGSFIFALVCFGLAVLITVL